MAISDFLLLAVNSLIVLSYFVTQVTYLQFLLQFLKSQMLYMMEKLSQTRLLFCGIVHISCILQIFLIITVLLLTLILSDVDPLVNGIIFLYHFFLFSPSFCCYFDVLRKYHSLQPQVAQNSHFRKTLYFKDI